MASLGLNELVQKQYTGNFTGNTLELHLFGRLYFIDHVSHIFRSLMVGVSWHSHVDCGHASLISNQ